MATGSSIGTTATCEPGDTPLSGGHLVGEVNQGTHNFDLTKSGLSLDRDGWTVIAQYSWPTPDIVSLFVEVHCFDNPLSVVLILFFYFYYNNITSTEENYFLTK